MPFTPITILSMWLKGLLSIAIIAAGVFLLRQWYEHTRVRETTELRLPEGQAPDAGLDAAGNASAADRGRTTTRWEPGINRETAELTAGVLLLSIAFVGQFASRGIPRLLLQTGIDDPRPDREGAVRRLRRPDGSELQVELYGATDGQPIVLTHGWGANSTEWYYLKKHLSDRFRLIVWDLPGLELSTPPAATFSLSCSMPKAQSDTGLVMARFSNASTLPRPAFRRPRRCATC